mgnify:CR=1 FL=1|tara:strand:- start:188 stop:838 length:651 start_codon:yes stop_codon:yes gene_type:complete
MSIELKLRILSAIILVPPVIAAIHFGAPYFEVMVCIGGAILIYEICSVSSGQLSWSIPAIIYVLVALLALLFLHSQNQYGAVTLYCLFVLVWTSDTVAYFFGRAIGGPKLAPRLSPNKTWSGFFGAVIGAALVGIAIAYYNNFNYFTCFLVSACLGAISQCGDLIESFYKRQFDKKDMSNLIPGHGGLSDRVDGLLAVASVYGLAQFFSGGTLSTW